MTDQRIQMIELLIQNTLKGTIDWKEATSDDQYQTTINNNTIVISEQYRTEASVVIRIYNPNGTMVETFDEEDLPPINDQQHYWYIQMSNLLDRARRNALGSDKVMQDIIDALSSPG